MGKSGKPLTQNHLARLLRPFGIISETVHPVGRPHAKGYLRARFEEAWEGYLPGQNPPSQPNPDFKACNRASADETGVTRNFQSVQEDNPHALKKGDLSYSHADLHACTVQKRKMVRKGILPRMGGAFPMTLTPWPRSWPSGVERPRLCRGADPHDHPAGDLGWPRRRPARYRPGMAAMTKQYAGDIRRILGRGDLEGRERRSRSPVSEAHPQ